MKFTEIDKSILATTNYENGCLSATSFCGKDDVYNIEIGKAIAHARLEKKVRQEEIKRLTNTRDGIEHLEWTEMKQSLIRSYVNEINHKIKVHKHYLSTQNKIIDLLTHPNTDFTQWNGMKENEIIRDVFNRVMKKK